jgi:cyclic lactone autoinducer peptide
MDVDLVSQKGERRSRDNPPLLTSYLFPKDSAPSLHASPVVPLATLVLFFSSVNVVEICVLYIYQDEIMAVLDESIAVDGVSVKLSTSGCPDIFPDRY